MRWWLSGNLVARREKAFWPTSLLDWQNLIIGVPSLTKTEAVQVYGFGWQWNDEQIKDYSERIEKIELLSVNDTIVMDSQAALEEFFTNNREGPFKKNVRVVFK